MKFLYKNLTAFSVAGQKYFTEVCTDGEKLYIKVYNNNYSTYTVTGCAYYNGEERAFSHAVYAEEILIFDYVERVKAAAISINGSRLDFTWHGSLSDPAPVVDISYTGIRLDDDFKAFFTYSGDAVNCALIVPKISYLRDDTWEILNYSPSKNTALTFSRHIFSDMSPGTPYRVSFLFACYASPNDSLENYIGLTEYTLPQFVLTGTDTPFAPNGFTYSPESVGVPFTVSWNPVNDPEFYDITYIVKREINGESYVISYRGSGCSFTDTLPGGTEKVCYYIKSSSYGIESAEYQGDEIDVSSANVYIGIDGRPVPATSIYIGKNGVPTLASATAFVG